MRNFLDISPRRMDKQLAKKYKAAFYGLSESLRSAGRRLNVPVLFGRDEALIILFFSGLYNIADDPYYYRRRNRYIFINEATDYVARMNRIFAYLYEKHLVKRRAFLRFKRAARIAYLHYPSKIESIEYNLELLLDSRHSYAVDPDMPASYMGKILAEVFAWKEDAYEKDLRDLGYYLGKFIFYSTAYESVDSSVKKDIYNPLLYAKNNDPAVFDTYVHSALQSLLSEVEAAMDKLVGSEDMRMIKNAVMDSLAAKCE